VTCLAGSAGERGRNNAPSKQGAERHVGPAAWGLLHLSSDAASPGSRVAFEVDGIDASAHTGLSVLVRGEAVEVTDPAELARAAQAARATGHGANYPKVSQAIWTAIQAAITGTASVSSALQTAQGTISSIQHVNGG
jgi:Pyridoxamine 5'-phosphate oxidase